jgi:hypothetical protein
VRLLNALLLILVAGCNSNSQPSRLAVPANAAWFACTADAMCSATWLSCHGWLAINRSHESDVQHWYRRENNDFLSRAECDGPPRSRPAAVCHDGACRLK